MSYVQAVMLSEEMIVPIRQAFSMFRLSDFAIIRGGRTVYGFNEELSIMKETELPEQLNLPDTVIISKSTAAKKITSFFLYNNAIIYAEDDYKDFFNATRRMNQAAALADGLIRDILTMKLTCSVQDMERDPGFAMTIMSMSAADGVRYFNYNGHMMSFYTGILPTTKTDIIRMDLFEHNGAPYFLTRFTIKKKTGLYVKVYLRFLKV